MLCLLGVCCVCVLAADGCRCEGDLSSAGRGLDSGSAAVLGMLCGWPLAPVPRNTGVTRDTWTSALWWIRYTRRRPTIAIPMLKGPTTSACMLSHFRNLIRQAKQLGVPWLWTPAIDYAPVLIKWNSTKGAEDLDSWTLWTIRPWPITTTIDSKERACPVQLV